uniref:Uncharacterized protein n=1 Tax=viral metagenome TaxID=1070528 RepID=A0A6H1ZRV1_9ZZZZ
MAVPYPISGYVYDIDGITVLANIKVTAINTTQGNRLPNTAIATTNSLGEFIIDLANLPTDYANNDKIHIVAYTIKKSLDSRHTVDTVAGSYSHNMVLHWTTAHLADCYLVGIVVANSYTGGLYVDLYDRGQPEHRIIRIEVAAGETESVFLGDSGKFFTGGICKSLEDETSERINVFTKVKVRH